MTKQEKEQELRELLDECLESCNQDGSIIDLAYDEDSNTCIVKLTVNEVERDKYIGFAGY